MGLRIYKNDVAHTTTAATSTNLGKIKGSVIKLEAIHTHATTSTISIHASSATTDFALYNEYLVGGASAKVSITTAGVRYYPRASAFDTDQSIPAAYTDGHVPYVVHGNLVLTHVATTATTGTYANTVSVMIYYDEF